MPTRPKTGLLLFFSGGAAPVYTISGTVYDADGSTPVEGATVALGLLTATSAANGTYSIASVPAGASGSMTCTLAGYSWTAITVAAMSSSLTGQDYDNAWWAAGGSAASAIAVYAPVGAASLAASKVNIVNPGTFDLTTTTDPAFNTLTGWRFTGASGAFLDTGVTLQNTYTVIARTNVLTFGQSSSGRLWAAGADTHFSIPISTAGENVAQYKNGSTVLTNVATAVGVKSHCIANTNAYLDGVDVGDVAVAALSAGTLFIGNRSAGARELNGYVYHFAVYNTTLTPAQVLALHNAMVALNP
jgi:hypothetical protein